MIHLSCAFITLLHHTTIYCKYNIVNNISQHNTCQQHFPTHRQQHIVIGIRNIIAANNITKLIVNTSHQQNIVNKTTVNILVLGDNQQTYLVIKLKKYDP